MSDRSPTLSPLTCLRPSSYFPGCMSPSSCLPGHQYLEYSRLSSSPRGRWRRSLLILKRLVRESRRRVAAAGSKPPMGFQYDAVSYSRNFDDGCHGRDHDERFAAGLRWLNRPVAAVDGS